MMTVDCGLIRLIAAPPGPRLGWARGQGIHLLAKSTKKVILAMEKRTPHCRLSVVRELIADGRVRTTFKAYRSARQIGIGDVQGMCAVVMALTPCDFRKSMTTYTNHRVWQDVYHGRTAAGVAVYLKLSVIDDVLIVSFKEL